VTAPDNSVLPGDPLNPCGENPSKSWRCVRAIRVALLARSSQWDQNHCAASRPQWTSGASGALALTPFTMTNVDGAADPYPVALPPTCNAADPNDWRRYRYSVYETVIPLRNMIWGTAP
jgi:type IV pilus assembly protein PilW